MMLKCIKSYQRAFAVFKTIRRQRSFQAASRLGELTAELSRGEKDWEKTRECFVKAFYHYPLYQHLIPNEEKRGEFLRQYLEANYDEAVRNDDSAVLICLNERNYQDNTERRVVGGLVLEPLQLLPNSSQADLYERFDLNCIDEKAFENVLRYEKWEVKNILNPMSATGIPMWNGEIFGIDPIYAGTGCGHKLYGDLNRILAKPLRNMFIEKTALPNESKTSEQFASWEHQATNDQLILAICHCKRAAAFHISNGFKYIGEVTYSGQKIRRSLAQKHLDTYVLLRSLIV